VWVYMYTSIEYIVADLHMDICMCGCVCIYVWVYMYTSIEYIVYSDLHMDMCMCVRVYVNILT